jgi:hypothetical protein
MLTLILFYVQAVVVKGKELQLDNLFEQLPKEVEEEMEAEDIRKTSIFFNTVIDQIFALSAEL